MAKTNSKDGLHLGTDFDLFSEQCRTYGAKSAGLSILPKDWTPPYFSISVDLYRWWKDKTTGHFYVEQLEQQINNWIDGHRDLIADDIIVRSSGVTESMADRGQLLSLTAGRDATYQDVRDAAFKIFKHAQDRGLRQEIAIVAQFFLKPDGAGHLSNEVRLSPTRNQWVYEVAMPTWIAPRGLNSKFAPRPDSSTPLRVQGTLPHATMRSVGHWINETVLPRAHIEWFVSRGIFWIAQLDLEWRELDEGLDPRQPTVFRPQFSPDPKAATVFNLYKLGDKTRWKKLKNLRDFDFTAENCPRLFWATGEDIDAAIRGGAAKLSEEIDRITAGRAVIRMEVISETVKSFNMPRTDTVDGQSAIKFLSDNLLHYGPLVDRLDDIAFFIHAFIPASAGAWAYAVPGQPIAYVDALWGLPDGLQVLPHDTYQIDVRHEIVSAKKIRFKPRFLTETDKGTWQYANVMCSKSRTSTLTDKDAIAIGVRTASIANRIQKPAQIMWFSGVPADYSIDANLPWFRAREVVDPAPRHSTKFPPFKITNAADLLKVPLRPVTLLLDPEAELIRNDAFLSAVIAKATADRLPVEIQGSALSHVYYRLFSADVAVNPPKFGEYSRVRGRRTFLKIVRDKIPEQIASGGEIVVEARLPKADAPVALLGKLLEEIREYHIASSNLEATEELADVLEVIMAVAKNGDIQWSAVEESRIAKLERRGGFEERRVLLETSFSGPDPKEEQLREVSLQEFEEPQPVGDKGLIFPYSALFSHASTGQLKIGSGTLHLLLRMEAQGILVRFRHVPYSNTDETQLELF